MTDGNMTSAERSMAWVGENLDEVRLVNNSESIDEIIDAQIKDCREFDFSVGAENYSSNGE